MWAFPWERSHPDQAPVSRPCPPLGWRVREEASMNLEDIARLAGVSRSTVSRVVNDDPRVSEAVRARVKAVIAEHNYHPNAAARSLASRRTRVVGLLIPAMASEIFSDPWFPVMIQGCMDGCQERDLSLMLLMESETDPEAANRLIERTLQGRHLDGVVVATSLVDPVGARLLEQHRVPHVVIGRTMSPQTSWVDIDNRLAAREATAHLLGHGRHRAAMLSGSVSLQASLDRVAGFEQAAAEAGVPAMVYNAEFDQRLAFDIVTSLLSEPDPPDAIFAASDVMAVGAIQAARRLQVGVPDDLGVIGFDDLHPARMAALGITSMRQPTRELGHRAIELLSARIEHPTNPPVHDVLSTELIIRESCGCPARDHAAPPQPDMARKEDTATLPTGT
jgi:LacI family transcriptional regulator